MENKLFEELNTEDMCVIDGGIAPVLLAFGVGCGAAFLIGVYNGYNGNA